MDMRTQSERASSFAWSSRHSNQTIPVDSYGKSNDSRELETLDPSNTFLSEGIEAGKCHLRKKDSITFCRWEVSWKPLCKKLFSFFFAFSLRAQRFPYNYIQPWQQFLMNGCFAIQSLNCCSAWVFLASFSRNSSLALSMNFWCILRFSVQIRYKFPLIFRPAFYWRFSRSVVSQNTKRYEQLRLFDLCKIFIYHLKITRFAVAIIW